jgi:HEAT repeat protein
MSSLIRCNSGNPNGRITPPKAAALFRGRLNLFYLLKHLPAISRNLGKCRFVSLPVRLIRRHATNEDAFHLPRLLAGNRPIDLRIALPRVADEHKPPLRKIRQNPLDDLRLVFLRRFQQVERRRIFPAEILHIPSAARKSLRPAQSAQRLIKLPRAGRDIVKCHPVVRALAIQVGHSWHGFKRLEERVFDQLLAVADAGDLNGVVNIGNDRITSGWNKEHLAAKTSLVSGGHHRLKLQSVDLPLFREPRHNALSAQGGNLRGREGKVPFKVPVLVRHADDVRSFANPNRDLFAPLVINQECRHSGAKDFRRSGIVVDSQHLLESRQEPAALQRVGFGFKNPAVNAKLPVGAAGRLFRVRRKETHRFVGSNRGLGIRHLANNREDEQAIHGKSQPTAGIITIHYCSLPGDRAKMTFSVLTVMSTRLKLLVQLLLCWQCLTIDCAIVSACEPTADFVAAARRRRANHQSPPAQSSAKSNAPMQEAKPSAPPSVSTNRLYSTSEYIVYEAAFDALKYGSRGVTTVCNAMIDPQQRHPEAIMGAIAEFGPSAQSAAPTVTRFLAHKSKSLRSQAAYTLGAIGSAASESLNTLKSMVATDVEPEVRRNAVAAIAKIGPNNESAARVVLQALKDSNAQVRYAAIENLGKFQPFYDLVAGPLDDSLGASANDLNHAALNAFAKLGKAPPDALRRIQSATKAKAFQDRIYAIEALSKIQPVADETLLVLVKCLEDSVWSVRREAAQVLGNFGKRGNAGLSKLQPLLKDDDQHVRVAAAVAVWKIAGDKDTANRVLVETLRAVEPIAKGQSENIQSSEKQRMRAAIEGLGTLGKDAAQSASELVKCLRHDDSITQKAILVALKQICFFNDTIIDEVDRLVDSDDQQVSRAAFETLGAFGAERWRKEGKP